MTTSRGWYADDDGPDDDDLLPADDPEPPRMHDGIPISGYNRGEPIPDLRQLRQACWREALRPLSHSTRRLAAAGVATPDDARVAMILVGGLMAEDPPAGVLPPAPRMPARGSPPARGSSRQVNFRLGPDEHARLVEAARAYGMRPGAFARALTVHGVHAALYEERRAR